MLFSVIYFLIGGAINFFKGSTKVIFTILVRIRNPVKPISYEKFLHTVGYIQSIEQAGDRGVAYIGRIRLVFGGIPLGLTWLAWWFALLGLLHLIVVPLALPEVLATFFADGLTWWILFLTGVFVYFSFYYIGFLFILLLFYIAKRQWYDKFLAIFLYILGCAELLLFFLSR